MRKKRPVFESCSVKRQENSTSNQVTRSSRRRMLQGCLASAGSGLLGAVAAGRPAQAQTPAAVAVSGRLDMTVRKVEHIYLHVPFRERPGRHMRRNHTSNWAYVEIIKLTLGCGVVGIGENIQYFNDDDLLDRAVLGRNAAELMWNDALGFGFQQALLDAVARTNDVPVYRLLGEKIREQAFISWWAVDMPGEEWAQECQLAIEQGYTAFKTKARPWFDLEEQCEILSRNLPAHFKVGVDFNGMLLDSARAVRYCQKLEKYDFLSNFETPIPQNDIGGNKTLRRSTRIPIAMHYGNPSIMTALREEICDILILNQGAAETIRQASVAAAAKKPFWLQHSGTQITAFFDLHLAAVLSHARLPAVNVHQIYAHPLVKSPLQVENGLARIPDSPGMGTELDEDAIERLRTQRIRQAPDWPKMLLAIRWPAGGSSYYRSEMQYRHEFSTGRLPPFPTGIYLEDIPDDGSSDWADLHHRTQTGGVHTAGRPM